MSAAKMLLDRISGDDRPAQSSFFAANCSQLIDDHPAASIEHRDA
jgi:hypothetical protein